MSDDICVNIFSGVNRLFTNVGNSIFQPNGGQGSQNGLQMIFLGLLLLLAMVMAVMHSQQRSKESAQGKPTALNVDRLDRN